MFLEGPMADLPAPKYPYLDDVKRLHRQLDALAYVMESTGRIELAEDVRLTAERLFGVEETIIETEEAW